MNTLFGLSAGYITGLAFWNGVVIGMMKQPIFYNPYSIKDKKPPNEQKE